MPDRAASILRSHAFARESMTSERSRIVWTIATLAVVALIAAAREAAFERETLVQDLLLIALLGGLAIAYEAVMLALLGRTVRAGRTPPEGYWVSNTAVEALFPTLVLTVVMFTEPGDPARVLTLPSVALYYLVIVLATMRLRPLLCVLSGVLGAAGYGVVIVYVFAAGGPLPETAGHPAVYATHGLMMVVAGLVAAAVASKIRGYLAAAVEEAELRQREQVQSRNTLILGLAKLAEHRDTDTGAHLERISEYASLLGEGLRESVDEIDDEWIETLRVAASLHDIGKVGIPDAVLCKPGRLDDDERSVMQRHTVIGAETVGAIRERQGEDRLLEMSEQIAAAHHERWDGGGYPSGLRAGEISLAARIISVADVYDALTSKRVYKPAMTHEKTMAIIREGRGTQFDPDVVDCLERLAATFDQVRRRYAKPAD